MKKIAIEPAPIVLALVLGLADGIRFPARSMGFRRRLQRFVTYPISLVCLVLAAGVLLLPLIRKTR
jgi:TctA family transporter